MKMNNAMANAQLTVVTVDSQIVMLMKTPVWEHADYLGVVHLPGDHSNVLSL